MVVRLYTRMTTVYPLNTQCRMSACCICMRACMRLLNMCLRKHFSSILYTIVVRSLFSLCDSPSPLGVIAHRMRQKVWRCIGDFMFFFSLLLAFFFGILQLGIILCFPRLIARNVCNIRLKLLLVGSSLLHICVYDVLRLFYPENGSPNLLLFNPMCNYVFMPSLNTLHYFVLLCFFFCLIRFNPFKYINPKIKSEWKKVCSGEGKYS